MPESQPTNPGIWQEIRNKGFKAYVWDNYFEEAAPQVRNFDVAYVPLQRQVGERKVDVGSMIPELHIIAEAGILPAQVAAKQLLNVDTLDGLNDLQKQRLKNQRPLVYKELFRTDGELKTPFELSIIPSYCHTRLQRKLTVIYSKMRREGYAWPNYISKIRAVPDYLARLDAAGLSVKVDGYAASRGDTPPTSGKRTYGAQSVYLSIKNHPSTATTREKIFHAVGPWLGWMVTLTATLSVLGISSWAMLFAAGVGTYIAVSCANQFDMFDKAEELYRLIGWMASPHYKNISKFSWLNFTRTAIKAASLAFFAYSAGYAAGAALLGLPFLVWAPAVEMGLAAFFGSLAAFGAWIGLSGAMRYLWGLSINDNQIDISVDEANRLPVLQHLDDTRSEINDLLDKLEEKGELDVEAILRERAARDLNLAQPDGAQVEQSVEASEPNAVSGQANNLRRRHNRS